MRHMEYVMHTHKPAFQVQLVGTLVNMLKDLVWSHIALVQLPDSCKVQVAGAQ